MTDMNTVNGTALVLRKRMYRISASLKATNMLTFEYHRKLFSVSSYIFFIEFLLPPSEKRRAPNLKAEAPSSATYT